MVERVLVMGAGMAGLWTAMALAGPDREVTVLDRDPPPPAGGPDAAFDDWQRRGVGHLRHSHAFLARLRTLARDRHPALLEALLAEGVRELGFEGSLTDKHKENYVPAPIDRDLAILTSRRTTLELVMRRYAEGLPGVTMRPLTFVKGLTIAPGAPPTVTGVVLEDGTELAADLVVDAQGKGSLAYEWLSEIGVTVPESAESCGVIYFTRHYRLRPGQAEPARGAGATTGDLGYLKFGVFPGDNGCFSVTLCVPEVEEEMRKAIVDPEVFDAMCRELPGLVPWIDPERTEATSRVFGMGQLESRWRELAAEGQPAVLGFFPVGDCVVRTNPLYGRGCSFAAVSAHLLLDALQATPDPAQRLIHYRTGIERELRPYYDVMRKADRSAIRRARAALLPPKKPTLKGKLAKSFLEDGVAIAIREDVDLLRSFLRGFHMLEHPQAWLKRPRNLAKIVRVWARGKAANAALYPAQGAPGRTEMLQAVGVSPDADVQRVRAQAA
ncbi:MAG: FAD-dependent oxidoreductase [Alphaproteobacteria bacterium]|nr:FAD-dependent oxidoreductase [Alphaproteobacteria bacterium]MBU1512459.1 FAD-dependent oxidoreductase [Alphaproteobacteria bacterium]MBU2095085.1 FAD-dependent oxidoreductase [Alphaproteobacteria bacterium]MBU2151274.1 FAD-dependent oxidoreductase [Alphaproteobacteria bacterium]MBU2308183.1 FAD-dependent oxidoreductase [Alphaproteobacteria bacterium]